MKTYIIVLLILVYSSSSQAVFEKIWGGYQASKINMSNHIDKEINLADYQFEENKMDWKLEFSPTHDNTYLDALFGFQAQKTIRNSMTLGLSKPTFKWGTFSLKHTQTAYDLSSWNASNLSSLPSDKLFETRNIVGYSYDFLDKNQEKDYELIQVNKEKGDAQANLKIEQGYFDFFSVYLQAKLQVFSVKLNKDFVSRANKRVEQIQKRVKDGLSRKVELLQAKTSLLNQQESLEKSRSALKQNLAILENIIGAKIQEEYFAKLDWIFHPFNYWKSYVQEEDHFTLTILEQQLAYSEKILEKIGYQNGYKLLLNANYTSNDIDESSSESLNQSLKGARDSKVIGLNFIIPLGGDKNEGLRKKYAYQKKKNELDLLNKKDELLVKRSALLEQIKYLEKAYQLSSSKVKISEETLNEQNRLYFRGQASFEEVIRAEENYINAELSDKRLIAEYEALIANYAFLNNGTKNILDIYKD